ncbi:MAG: type VI secretion system-associated FHA domain protein TagH [Gammaproteobacteria bacterium]|nr:type VI secretion system-associated FHA domain protein TagH [Gammaproteobacteria bacterium]
MSLTLKIISPTNMPPGQLPEFTFDELGGSIGRKPSNDFILVDPERFISSQHASIEYHNGKFSITDTSTNGVFINNSKRPVGTGNTQELSNGDEISIGEFQLQVISSELSKPNTAWESVPATSGPAAADLFDFSSPLESTQENGSSGSLNSMDPLALLGGSSSDAANNFQPQQNISDSAFDSAFSSTPNNTPGATHDDFFEDILENPHQNIPTPLPINEPFTPPSAIPDDWDIMGDDLLGGGQNQNTKSENAGFGTQAQEHIQPPHSAPLFPDTENENTTPLIPEGDSFFDEDDIFASLSTTAQPIQSAASHAPPQTIPQPTPPQVAPTQPQIVAPSLSQTATPTHSPQPAQSISSNNRELLDAFIKGAGLDPSQVKTDNPAELLLKLGQLTRISTEGLMMALRARSTIKSSFRVNKTIIAPIENNPLKFSVTSEDALNIIFADEKTGYMSATEAFSEGFKDLQTHQMAMMAGMQAIIKEITEQFSPQKLERNFEHQKTSGNSFMPGNKKAKNWELYEIFYKKMTETLQDDFQNVYGEEFARAYENQIRKLM